MRYLVDQVGGIIMKSQIFQVAVAAVMVVSAPAIAQTTPLRLSPAQAVINAAEMPAGIGGVFEMVVRATGRQDGFLYLNSEADYRDPRNLTIVVTPSLEKELSDRLGGPVEAAILKKVIAVRGIARKTRIDFVADGRPTGKYYFQTHLRIRSARDLTVEGERPMP
ncbi:MAG: hypothetical protein BVN33_01765 [Proteobacteria bacterium ST_bin13]|nr:MAG: hypothetical protein BVN33_01765 [Proteobacteria bacterium ST_bin13]